MVILNLTDLHHFGRFRCFSFPLGFPLESHAYIFLAERYVMSMYGYCGTQYRRCDASFVFLVLQRSTLSTLSRGRSPRAPSQGTVFFPDRCSVYSCAGSWEGSFSHFSRRSPGWDRFVSVNCRVPGFSCLSGVVSTGLAFVDVAGSRRS